MNSEQTSRNMKRLRSSNDLNFYEKNASKESNQNQNRPSSHRSNSSGAFYYKTSSSSDGNRTKCNFISSSRYDRDRSVAEEDSGRERERDRLVRKRTEYELESYDRRKLGFDRYRESGSSSLRRSESFSGPRREFLKGFRSDRDRNRHESGSGSSWRRFGIDENRGSSKMQLREFRDVMSPTRSRDSLGSGRVLAESRERGDLRRSSKSRSPTWSRDSGSEQSKSVGGGGGVKKSEETLVESETSSEMEEGEFDPEPQPQPQPVPADTGIQIDEKESGHSEMENDGGGEMNSNEEAAEVNKEMGNDRIDEVKEDDESQICGKMLDCGTSCVGDKMDGVNGDKVGIEEIVKVVDECVEVSSKDAVVDKSSRLEENYKEDKGIDLEMQVEECEASELNKEDAKEDGDLEMHIDAAEIGLIQNVKDKGKGVIVESLNVTDSLEDGIWMERELKDTDGPSSRGFDLFSCSPVRKVEKAEPSDSAKQKDEKLALESLDLSLSLPNVLLPIGAEHKDLVPDSPSHGRSAQSANTFPTNSDGFTASMSFSGSQSFYHNPSCSLNQNSVDMEQSVHSHSIFQGVDQFSQLTWQSQNESRHKEVSMFQRIMTNGNSSFSKSSALQGTGTSQAVQAQNIHTLEGSSKIPSGIERQLSFHKQNDVRSTSQSVGSHEIGSNYSFGKKLATVEKHGSSLYRSSSQKEQEPLLIGGAEFVETIIGRMISEPIHVMARKFHGMTGQSIACLKESIREIMLNPDKYGCLFASQEALQNRTCPTLETMIKSHRAQLEIMVALITGLPEYLQVDNSISSSDLAEIFLNLRCRNLMCRSPVPVDECDCKVCSKKNGFCCSCMCLVCSKFDMASNTCCWVGCDVCLHWCHTDCALRESYIRNGDGAAEMQFHCVACDHPSEMFGFVKEVFLNFAKEWTLETFSKELKYVTRIFSGSKDVRGKQLHEIANQMLVRLAKKSDLPQVYSQIMLFLRDSDSSNPGNRTVLSGKEQGKGINVIDGSNQDTTRPKSVYSAKASHLESCSLLPGFHVGRTARDKGPLESELQRSAQKQSVLPELESFVRIKQEAAKMYQTRADDARREAESLNRIAMTKNEKIEEEYMSRITKLRLVEAEEIRKQKFEELQALDRAYREYYGMKTRMEADIKDLLLKMEATRGNLAM